MRKGQVAIIGLVLVLSIVDGQRITKRRDNTPEQGVLKDMYEQVRGKDCAWWAPPSDGSTGKSAARGRCRLRSAQTARFQTRTPEARTSPRNAVGREYHSALRAALRVPEDGCSRRLELIRPISW